MNRSHVAAGGLLAAVFVTGLIVGNAGSAAIADRDRKEKRPPRTPYIETLQERLGLSTDQQHLIENVLEEFRATWHTTTRELREEERRKIQDIRGDASSKVIALLDSGQADEYRQMFTHTDSVRAAMFAHTDSVRAARFSRRQR